MKNSYEILIACEKLGAHTIEIKESDLLLDEPLTGVANSTERNTVQCFLGEDALGEHDCEITPDDFAQRFQITAALFS